ncbi:unnamed protein product, partial [Clonostachys chloroleuca]
MGLIEVLDRRHVPLWKLLHRSGLYIGQEAGTWEVVSSFPAARRCIAATTRQTLVAPRLFRHPTNSRIPPCSIYMPVVPSTRSPRTKDKPPANHAQACDKAIGTQRGPPPLRSQAAAASR